MTRRHLCRIGTLATVATVVSLAASTQVLAASPGTFTATGSMNAAHAAATATQLQDGERPS